MSSLLPGEADPLTGAPCRPTDVGPPVEHQHDDQARERCQRAHRLAWRLRQGAWADEVLDGVEALLRDVSAPAQHGPDPEQRSSTGDAGPRAAAASSDDAVVLATEPGIGDDASQPLVVNGGRPRDAASVADGGPRDASAAGELDVREPAELGERGTEGADPEGEPSIGDGLAGAAELGREHGIPFASEAKDRACPQDLRSWHPVQDGGFSTDGLG